MVEVVDSALQQAAGEGMDAFIQVFTDAYEELTGGELTAETMPLLTGEQLRCWRIRYFVTNSWKVVFAS